jgi:hypothetical protein
MKGPQSPATSNIFQLFFRFPDLFFLFCWRVKARRKGQASVYLSATNTIGLTSSKISLANINEDDQAIVVMIRARYDNETLFILGSSN